MRGASIRSWRRAAMEVMVRQWPRGNLAPRRPPRGAQPRSGAISVLAQVSSTKTRRAGSGGFWYLRHCSRRHATFRRSCSAAARFFEAQPFVLNEPADLNIVDLQATLGQLGKRAAQSEVEIGSLEQPVAMVVQDCRATPAGLARRWAASPPCRCDQRTTLTASPLNVIATDRTLPPANSRATIRSRKSIEQGRSSPLSLTQRAA